MARKTAPLVTMIERVNHFMAEPDSESCTKSARFALAALLTGLLLDADAYAGFGYQSSELTSDGTLKDVYDESRRRYFVSSKLTK